MDEITEVETLVEPSADYTDQLDQIIQQNVQVIERLEKMPDYTGKLDQVIQQNTQVIDYLDHMYKLQHAQADALAFQNGVIGLVGLIVVIAVGIYIVRS